MKKEIGFSKLRKLCRSGCEGSGDIKCGECGGDLFVYRGVRVIRGWEFGAYQCVVCENGVFIDEDKYVGNEEKEIESEWTKEKLKENGKKRLCMWLGRKGEMK